MGYYFSRNIQAKNEISIKFLKKYYHLDKFYDIILGENLGNLIQKFYLRFIVIFDFCLLAFNHYERFKIYNAKRDSLNIAKQCLSVYKLQLPISKIVFRKDNYIYLLISVNNRSLLKLFIWQHNLFSTITVTYTTRIKYFICNWFSCNKIYSIFSATT